MESLLSSGPTQEEASEEDFLAQEALPVDSVFHPPLAGDSFTMTIEVCGQERAFCLLKMSSIHNCAFSEFGHPHFLTLLEL